MRGKGALMNNRGYMTIEASVIIPVVLFGIFATILGLMLAYERGHIKASENERLYTVPLEYIRNENVEEYLNAADYEKGIVCGSAAVSCGYSGHKATAEGVLRVIDENEVNSGREIGVCTDRLRRWQLYDDTFEE